MNVTLKERDTNQVVFSAADLVKTDQASIVSKGAKFKFIRTMTNAGLATNQGRAGTDGISKMRTEVLVARGPLIGSVVVMAFSNQLNAKYKASIKFTVSKANGPLSSISQNEWVIKGWSRCSKECGGGKQHLLVRWVTKWRYILLFIFLIKLIPVNV